MSGTDAIADGAIVNHVGQCTADLGRATSFYADALGFEVERRLNLPDDATADFLRLDRPVNLTAVYLRRGSFVLELLHFDRPVGPEHSNPRPRTIDEPGLTHLSVSVEDLDRTVDRVVALGGEVVSHRPGAAALVRDPDGQLIELLPMSYRGVADAG